MNLCDQCFAKMEACGECADAIIAGKDAEIFRLRALLKEVVPYIGQDDIAGISEIQNLIEAELVGK